MHSTFSILQAAARTWDCLVIGAGPAGSFAARSLARAGKSVLLVDAKSFPREKVCGGCVNYCAQNVLRSAELDQLMLKRVEPLVIDRIRIVCGRRQVNWQLPHPIWSIRRSQFDLVLMESAAEAGAAFLGGTSARVMALDETSSVRRVMLKATGCPDTEVHAKVVLCADGLQHSSLIDHPQFNSVIEPKSRIGIQATLSRFGANAFAAPLTMAIGDVGYVGLAALHGDEMQIAAALDPDRLSSFNRPAVPVEAILRQSGLTVPDGLHDAHWMGTPPFSRQSPVIAGPRLFLIGDAIGYVEPFTGEGMACALMSAHAVIPLVLSAVDQWQPQLVEQWQATVNREIGQYQWLCRNVSRLLHYPMATKAALMLCNRVPPMRRYFLQHASGGANAKVGA